MSAHPLLEVRGLNAGYGRSSVLFDAALDIGPGEIVGLLGRNGMGKTTLVRSVMGQLKPRTGEIRFDGQVITGHSADRVARRGIALVPEGRQIFAARYMKVLPTESQLAREIERERRVIDARRVGKEVR